MLISDKQKSFAVLVVGLGNELLTDDGVGVHIARRLQAEPLDDRVTVIEAGTAVLHVQHLLEQSEYVIAIDAVRAGDEPGAVYGFESDQAEQNLPVTLHDLGLIGTLRLMHESLRPKTFIVGIEPETIAYGMTLSPAVQAAVPSALGLIQNMIAELLSSGAGSPAALMKKDRNAVL